MNQPETRQAQLERDLESLGLLGVDVEIEGKVAILRGVVAHGEQRQMAVRACRACEGIREVHDLLRVDIVDRASMDSFPASDPPSFTR